MFELVDAVDICLDGGSDDVGVGAKTVIDGRFEGRGVFGTHPHGFGYAQPAEVCKRIECFVVYCKGRFQTFPYGYTTTKHTILGRFNAVLFLFDVFLFFVFLQYVNGARQKRTI